MKNEAEARRIVYTYEIRLKGHLDARRTRHFEGLTATWLPSGETLLVGPWPIRLLSSACWTASAT